MMYMFVSMYMHTCKVKQAFIHLFSFKLTYYGILRNVEISTLKKGKRKGQHSLILRF